MWRSRVDDQWERTKPPTSVSEVGPDSSDKEIWLPIPPRSPARLFCAPFLTARAAVRGRTFYKCENKLSLPGGRDEDLLLPLQGKTGTYSHSPRHDCITCQIESRERILCKAATPFPAMSKRQFTLTLKTENVVAGRLVGCCALIINSTSPILRLMSVLRCALYTLAYFKMS